MVSCRPPNVPVAPYRLVLDDAKRNLSKRPGSHHDCTVRALAIVTQMPFDTVYETLAKAGRKPCDGFDIDQWLARKRGRVLGGRFRRVSVRGLTPATFAARYPKGRYLVSIDDHIWAVINRTHHDLIRVKEQPLEGAWVWARDRS